MYKIPCLSAKRTGLGSQWQVSSSHLIDTVSQPLDGLGWELEMGLPKENRPMT